MKIGIFGGSFNPPHIGHIELCRYVFKEAKLDRVVLIPTGDNPIKTSDNHTDRFGRLKMAQIAAADDDFIEVSDIEIRRQGESYTVDTVRELNKNGSDAYYFVCGCDLLLQMDRWKAFAELCRSVRFLCVDRTGVDFKKAVYHAEALQKKYGASIQFYDTYAPTEISSTQLREMLASGRDCSAVLHPGVAAYIKQHNPYGKTGGEYDVRAL